MKKIEILKLIEANKIIKKNSNILSINKNDCFPHIEELKEEFNILEKEIHTSLYETQNCKNYIQNSGCNHEIRLEHYGLFCNYSRCVLCGATVTSDNYIKWEYSINRNKYCVNLIAKYQDNDDYGYVPDGYTNEQVYEMIINILKDKEDNVQIDLVQELKTLNLQNCKINEEKKVAENYILIVGGSNKQYIADEFYLSKNGLKIGLDFTKYFSSLLNTKVELIDNSEILESDCFKKYFPSKNDNLKFTKYDTIEQLEKILKSQINIPFKIIIDLSELYNYNISADSIKQEQYNLQLKTKFPNSHIIRISDLSKTSLEKLSIYLKQTQTNEYAYKSNNYYFFENEEICSLDLEDTCNKIKKLLLSKKINS